MVNYTQLITNSLLVVHFNLNKYSIVLKSALVCPQIHKIVSHESCYACATLMIITISASSTCLLGTVIVTFTKIKGYSPGLNFILVQEYQIQVAIEYNVMSGGHPLSHPNTSVSFGGLSRMLDIIVTYLIDRLITD